MQWTKLLKTLVAHIKILVFLWLEIIYYRLLSVTKLYLNLINSVYVCVSPSLHLSINCSVCPSVCPSIPLPIHLSICQSFHSSINLSFHPSIRSIFKRHMLQPFWPPNGRSWLNVQLSKYSFSVLTNCWNSDVTVHKVDVSLKQTTTKTVSSMPFHRSVI